MIQGQLPYSISYVGPLRQNLTATLMLQSPTSSTSGWTDNYHHYIRTIRYSNSVKTFLPITRTGPSTLTAGVPTILNNVSALFYVKLPGDKSETVFKYQMIGTTTTLRRLYSADPAGAIYSAQSIDSLPWSSDLGEYTFSANLNGQVSSITRYGTTYNFNPNRYTIASSPTYTATSYIWLNTANQQMTTIILNSTGFTPPTGNQTNAVAFQISTVAQDTTNQQLDSVSYPNGHKLTFAYDGKLNVTQIKDNRNNVLTFERKYTQSLLLMNQTTNESRAITQVSLSSGNQGDVQIAKMGYNAYNIYEPSSGLPVTVFSLASTDSPLAGKHTYTHTSTQIGSISKYFQRSQLISAPFVMIDPKYHFPILTKVTNSLDQIEQQWNITQDYALNLNAANVTTLAYLSYSRAKTTIQSLRPGVSGFASAMDMTTSYNDVLKTTNMSFRPGVDSNPSYANLITTVATTPNTSTTTVPNDTSTVTLAIPGNFPCFSVGGKPISSATFDTLRSRMISSKDKNGTTSTYSYDSISRLKTVTEAVGTPQQRITDYTYTTFSTGVVNTTSVPNTIVTPVLTVTNILNARGQITSQTKTYSEAGSPAPKTWLFYYHENASLPNYGLLHYATGPTFTGGVNDKESWVYDNYGNVATHERFVNNSANTPVLRQTTYANYNSAGQPAVANYPDGTKDTMIYNASYRLLSKVQSGSTGSMTTSNTYDSLNRVISATDADGKVTTYAYDGMGRLSTVTDPSGNTTNTTYFPNNSVSSVIQKNPSNQIAAITKKTLDVAGRLRFTLQGSGNALSYTIDYDANNNVTNTYSGSGITNTWTYDALNRVITHKDGNGNIDTKRYDAADNNITEKAANISGSDRAFIYGGHLKSEINTDFGLKRYSYDNGNRLTRSEHEDRSCDFGIVDQENRPRIIDCWGSGSADLKVNDTYSFDTSAYGNLDKVTATIAGIGVTTSYTYDAFHRVISKTQVNQAPTTSGQQTNSYSYTAGGKLANMTLPSGGVVTYGYNAAGLINNLKLGTTTLVSNINFDGANRLRGWSWGTASGAFNLAINDTGLTTGVSNTNRTGVNNFNAAYFYDSNGRIVRNDVNNIYKYFIYDNNSQLLNEVFQNGSKITYTYDTNGNRLALATTGTTGLPYTSAGYGYTGNRLTAWTKNGVAQTLGASAQGELTSTYIGTASYDYAGRRKQESPVPGNGLYTGMTFDYNHKNERTFRRGNNLDRQYAYDESSHLIGEYTGNGALIVEYVWLGDRPIAAVYPNNRIVYLVTDHQNKPRRGIDAATQAVVWSWDPDAFGVLQPAAGLPNGVEINLRFPGQYYDVHSGLYYNHNRYYNPELGRYMEPDPIGLAGGLNPYAYVGNDPVNKVDPSGLIVGLSDSQLSGVFGSPAPGGSSSGGGYIPSGVGGGGGVTVNGQGGNYYWQGSSSSTTTSGTTVTTSTGYSPNYVSTSYSPYTLSAGTFAITTLGFNSTPGLGGGVAGGYMVTGTNFTNIDAGTFVSTSQTTGFGAGIGMSVDYYTGDRSAFDGRSQSNTVCLILFCSSYHTDMSGNFNGGGFSLFGNTNGGILPGGSFTHGVGTTNSSTIRDFIEWLKKR